MGNSRHAPVHRETPRRASKLPERIGQQQLPQTNGGLGSRVRPRSLGKNRACRKTPRSYGAHKGRPDEAQRRGLLLLFCGNVAKNPSEMDEHAEEEKKAREESRKLNKTENEKNA